MSVDDTDQHESLAFQSDQNVFQTCYVVRNSDMQACLSRGHTSACRSYSRLSPQRSGPANLAALCCPALCLVGVPIEMVGLPAQELRRLRHCVQPVHMCSSRILVIFAELFRGLLVMNGSCYLKHDWRGCKSPTVDPKVCRTCQCAGHGAMRQGWGNIHQA